MEPTTSAASPGHRRLRQVGGEVTDMRDDSILVAVEDATRNPRFCTCGNYLAVVETDDAMWLECPTYAQPSRLPAKVASLLRSVIHDRVFIVAIPENLRRPATALPAARSRVTRTASAAHA